MIATAALATGVGFLVLLLSPVPMVRGFGALLVVGSAIAFVVALTAGTAALTLGALVLALSTEFAVLLDARVQQERAAGLALPEALARAYRSTGAAVLTAWEKYGGTESSRPSIRARSTAASFPGNRSGSDSAGHSSALPQPLAAE